MYHWKAQVSHLERALLQMLHDAARVELGVAGKVHFAKLQHDVAVRVHQDRRVEPPPAHRAAGVVFLGDLGIAELEPIPNLCAAANSGAVSSDGIAVSNQWSASAISAW
jgi:hypothetical protein